MPDDEKYPDKRSTEGGYAPAVAHKLRQALEKLPTPFPCKYACFIHRRRRAGEEGFGVITLAGESLPLTVEMLAGLRQVPTLIEGRTPVVIGPADPVDVTIPGHDGSWQEPLPVPRFLVRMLPVVEEKGEAGYEEQAATDEVVTADHGWTQISLLCASRPAGWPA